MGYSARYHAASLAAVFLALAIGIVIGVGLGQDVVASSTESLEESLQEDVTEAREQVEELNAELEREREFGQSAYPAIVGGRLRGETVGLVALGELSEDLAGDVEAAIEPTDGRVTKVAVVRMPPDLERIAAAAGPGGARRALDDPEQAEELGEMIGRELVMGGPLLRTAREEILARFSGRPGPVEHMIVARQEPEGLEGSEAELSERFETGVLAGISSTPVQAVGVERSDTEPSSIPLFESHELPTSDSIDLTSGRVAMVFALLGADGSFGIKETADRMLPDLIPPLPSTGAVPPADGAGAGGQGSAQDEQ